MQKMEGFRVSRENRAPTYSKKDQLEYIADLLLELRAMAHQHELATLVGILDLAYAEVRLRAKDCR